MLPSPRLAILFIVAAPMFLCGVLFPPMTGFAILYLLALGAWMLLDAFLLPGRDKLIIERFVPARLSISVSASFRYRLTNNSRRTVEVILAEDLPENLAPLRPEVTLVMRPREAGEVENRVVARRRGHYALSDLEVRLRPAGGLFYRQFRLKLPAEIQVFPNLTNVKRYELQIKRGLLEQGISRVRDVGQGTEFESLRPYGPWDSMSRVDWKATARRSRLIVRNYEAERQQSILIAIDTGRASAGEFEGLSRLDYFVNAALMLAYVSLRQGDRVSLVTFSRRVGGFLPPIRGVHNLDRVARELYRLEPKIEESDYAAVCRFIGTKHRKRSLICLMTDVIDRDASAEIISYMGRFARYHLPLIVTLTDTDLKAAAERPLAEAADPYVKAVALDTVAAREEALHAMRRAGVMVLQVAPSNLTPELINRYLWIKSAHRL